jgi:small nuclear ribonucleoprotein (snRNP)-like protein
MLKQVVSFALAAAVLFANEARPAHASPQGEKEARRVEKLKERAEKYRKRGTRRVQVKLKDGRKLKGRVVGTSETDFLLADAKAGTTSMIRYDEVKEVRPARPRHQWVGPAVGFAFLIVTTLATVAGLDK